MAIFDRYSGGGVSKAQIWSYIVDQVTIFASNIIIFDSNMVTFDSNMATFDSNMVTFDSNQVRLTLDSNSIRI